MASNTERQHSIIDEGYTNVAYDAMTETEEDRAKIEAEIAKRNKELAEKIKPILTRRANKLYRVLKVFPMITVTDTENGTKKEEALLLVGEAIIVPNWNYRYYYLNRFGKLLYYDRAPEIDKDDGTAELFLKDRFYPASDAEYVHQGENALSRINVRITQTMSKEKPY